MNTNIRYQVLQMYRNLLHMGKEYPKGYDFFRVRLKAAFMKNKNVTDEETIKSLLSRGEFVQKELESLYYLRKYRTLKRRYGADDKPLKDNEPLI